MRSNIPKKFGQLFFGIFFAFCISEIILRIFGFAPHNTNTFDKNNLVIFKPSSSFLIKNSCFQNTLVSNSFGFHSFEYPLQKPSSTYRIIILGDSFVEAAQVPLSKTFFALLEKKLNEMNIGIRYEVIPIAKSGHGTLLNLLYAREYALQFDPDLVIESFITNDLHEDMVDIFRLHAKQQGDEYDPESLFLNVESTGSTLFLWIKHFVLERSLLFEQAWMNFLVLKQNYQNSIILTDVNGKTNVDLEIQTQVEPHTVQANEVWENEQRSFATMYHFFEQKKIKFLLLHLTEAYLIEPSFRSFWNLNSEMLNQFDQNLVQQKLFQIASTTGFEFFSTQPFFVSEYKKTGNLPVWSCDNHYNYLGHEWTAGALFRFLENSSLLPDSKKTATQRALSPQGSGQIPKPLAK